MLGYEAHFAQVYGLAVKADAAAVRQGGGNGVDERGFVRAVGADQAGDLPGGQRGAHVLEDFGPAAPGADIASSNSSSKSCIKTSPFVNIFQSGVFTNSSASLSDSSLISPKTCSIISSKLVSQATQP